MPSQDREPRRGYRCPFCNSPHAAMRKTKVSTAGWIVFLVFLLTVACFPLCVVGLFLRDEYRVCPSCNMNVGA